MLSNLDFRVPDVLSLAKLTFIYGRLSIICSSSSAVMQQVPREVFFLLWAKASVLRNYRNIGGVDGIYEGFGGSLET